MGYLLNWTLSATDLFYACLIAGIVLFAAGRLIVRRFLP